LSAAASGGKKVWRERGGKSIRMALSLNKLVIAVPVGQTLLSR
jgi:hypothetical protein